MVSERGGAEERAGDDGDGSDEEDLKWRSARRKRESSDEDGEESVVRSVSPAGAKFGDDSDGLGGAPPSDYFDDVDVGDGEDDERRGGGGGGEEVGKPAAMTTEKRMCSQGDEDKERKEEESIAVPRRGEFYMHDDRTGRRGRGRQNYGPRRLIEPHDEGKWQHDKFEQIQESSDKKDSSRIVKGRGPVRYPPARGYSRYQPEENEKAGKSQEMRSNSGRVLAEASSQQVGSPALKKEVSASHQNRAAEASSQQVGSSALKKEVSESHPSRAAAVNNRTISTFNRAISALTKRDVQRRNMEGNSPKSVLLKDDPPMETAFASPPVRSLGDPTERDHHPSKELILENNFECVQWQGQGTGLPFSPQHAYQNPSSDPNGGSLMINNNIVPQTSINSSIPPCFQGYVSEYRLFGPPYRAIVPSASEIGTLFLSAGLNTELIHPAVDRQAAFQPLQPVMTWANGPQSLQWNGQGIHLPPSSQHAYQYTASNQNVGALMINNLVIPQTPFGNSFQHQFQGYGQELYSPSGSPSGLDRSEEIAMAGRESGADGTRGRTYSGVDSHANPNSTTTANLFPDASNAVNQVRRQHHGELGDIGIANPSRYYAAEPSFRNSASGLAWPQVLPANAGNVGSAYPSYTYAAPTTSAYRRGFSAEPTERESSLSITGNEDTGRPHEGSSNPVDGSEMPNTARGEGHKLQRYSKMNFDPSK